MNHHQSQPKKSRPVYRGNMIRTEVLLRLRTGFERVSVPRLSHRLVWITYHPDNIAEMEKYFSNGKTKCWLTKVRFPLCFICCIGGGLTTRDLTLVPRFFLQTLVGSFRYRTT